MTEPSALVVGTAIAVALTAAAAAQDGSELLYNGIRLPADWPPPKETLTREPPGTPPYLEQPPAVIPIDVGRQLFVDDFLIEETTLTRSFHAAEYYADNPVLAPDKPWEQEGRFPTAMPFSDGVWYDPAGDLYKMWYMGGYVHSTCYATSKDGVHWEKPELDVVPGTNVVHTVGRDSGTVWLDLGESDPRRRYKLFIYPLPEGSGALQVYFSPDGVHWSDSVVRSGPCGDRTTVFLNPFRDVWVYSIREYIGGVGRCRRYAEDADVIDGAKWEKGGPPFWVGADDLDPIRDDIKTPNELYNLDCVAYESLLLGLFSMWRGQPKDRAKPNEIVVGFSRDGYHWDRPVRTAFIPVSERHGDWNWANVQSAGGCCLVVGDELRFYVSGRAGIPGSSGSGICATGLATLRRDGFASMEAEEGAEGSLTTRPLRFTGTHLFVNVDADDGELRVEALDERGNAVERFSRARCVPIRGDDTCRRVRWRGASDLSSLAGAPVRFRFHVRGGHLYSFWVTPDESGASHGYVAAGGPGFSTTTDTVGATARW